MYRVGLENNYEGHSLAWVLGHPGCFVNGADGAAALLSVPGAIQAYRQRIASHTSESWLTGIEYQQDDYCVEETWECYSVGPDYELVADGYEVNAWFRHDWIPLTIEDVQRGLLLLRWGREELLSTVGKLSPEILERNYPNERWSIAGILRHISDGEWWYQDRFGLAIPDQDLPENPFHRLEKVRSNLEYILPGFVGSKQVIGISGEFWSPRKMLRRAVWHELDHIDHIRKLL